MRGVPIILGAECSQRFSENYMQNPRDDHLRPGALGKYIILR